MNEQLYIIENNGKRRKAEKALCETCKEEYLRRVGVESKFCSTKCFHVSQRNRVDVSCFQCGKCFEKTLYKMNSSKHGYYFCTRECKEKAQSMKGNCTEIRPSHYGTSDSGKAYRRLITETDKPCCESCMESRKYILVIHHKDGNRNNNPLDCSNWEIVCCNCHALRHLKFINGNWVFDSRHLTPRDMLKKL